MVGDSGGRIEPAIFREHPPQKVEDADSRLEDYLICALRNSIPADLLEAWVRVNMDWAMAGNPRSHTNSARTAIRSVLCVVRSSLPAVEGVLPLHIQQQARRALESMCPCLGWCTRSDHKMQVALLEEVEAICYKERWVDMRAVFTSLYDFDVIEAASFLAWQRDAGSCLARIQGWMDDLASALDSNSQEGSEDEW